MCTVWVMGCSLAYWRSTSHHDSGMVFNTAFWRKWHRWIAFPATLFLLFASITGVILGFTEFFGAEEALREATRSLVSPMTVAAPPTAWSEPVARALAAVNQTAPGSPIDKIEFQ